MGLVGGIASGKSSILEIIAGIKKPDSGYLFLDGSNRPWADASLLNVKIIDRDYGLVNNLTIWENMLLLEHRLSGCTAVFRASVEISRLDTYFQQHGVDINPHRNVAELPDYEKLIVSLLIASFSRIRVIFLDNFEHEFSSREMEAIRTVLKKLTANGLSFVISSMSSSSVYRLCDRIVFVSDGCVFYSLEKSDNEEKVKQIVQLSKKQVEGKSYSIERDNGSGSSCSEGRQHGFRFGDEVFTFRPGEYIAFIDPTREQIDRMFEEGVSYWGAQKSKSRWLNNDIMMLDVSDLDRTIHWMSPAENISLGMFQKLSPGGLISRNHT